MTGSSTKKNKLWRLFTTKRNASRYNERVVHIGNQPVFDADPQGGPDQPQTAFVGNNIKTSKYTWYTFVPKNLFEQFRRIANFYFLIVGLVQLVIDSPVSPFVSIAPLVFVVSVTMIKQGYEDFCRHRADREVNDKIVLKIENGEVRETKANKIQVGNIICVREGESFPCDLVLLSSSFPNGKANIMTANLDGETNLKTHNAPQLTRAFQSPRDLNRLRGVIECENPNADLHRFVGKLKVSPEGGGGGSRQRPKTFGLGPENVVLRGTQLRTTEYVYGCAVYTGEDTKMSKNSKMTSNKFSTVEKSMNKYLLFFLLLLLCQVILCTLLKYYVSMDRPNCTSLPWYLKYEGFPEGECIVVDFENLSQDLLSFLVLFNYIIPISLYVTLELQKFCGSMFLVWDVQLYDAEMDQPAKCNSSDLNEELGQVEYLFSDKTGTLTENVMEFKKCSIDGIRFHDEDKCLILEDEHLPKERKIRKFLEALALCHTVQTALPSHVSNNNAQHEQLIYNAASPDEKAIVEACRNYGVTFLGEKERDGVISMKLLLQSKDRPDEKMRFQRLHVLEFDSNRKCMSILVEDGKGKIKLITKGAESSVLPKCIKGPVEATAEHINDYALVGLRTLAVASKTVSTEEYEEFVERFHQVNQEMTDREKKVKALYTEFEQDMELLGAIAVEDKLQEDVKGTLVRLGMAGIKVWILTGDKRETAINISYSCGHFQRGLDVIDIANNDVNTIANALEAGLTKQHSSPGRKWGLVVDGGTLKSVFMYEDNLAKFRELADNCIAVICCRMSPLQKADIVKMIKTSPKKPITAAVGDGANDVSMIQEAHVGLGITGKEGRAAVRAADFAFAKFKHLQRVLLVHGHWYYYRVAMLVQYFFYKNVAGFTAQVYFAFFSDYSTQTLYDSLNLTLYNIVFTSLPVFVFGLMEQHLPDHELLEDPILYKKNARNHLLSVREFSIWFAEAVWHSFITFFSFYAFFSFYLNMNSDDFLERTSFGIAVYHSVIVVVTIRLLLQSRHWNAFFIASIILSLLAFLIFTFFFHGVRADPWFANLFLEEPVPSGFGAVPLSFETYWVIFHVLESPGVWLLTIWIVVTSLVPDIFIAAIRKSSKHFSQRMQFLRRSYRKGAGRKTFQEQIQTISNMENDIDLGGFDNRAYVRSTEELTHIA